MSEKRTENHPEISVIVPVYKVEKYLNECIDSILAQTFTDFELILVDDGSPDSCPALFLNILVLPPRISVLTFFTLTSNSFSTASLICGATSCTPT